MLNLLLPTLFYTLVISSKRPELNMCLGKAYLNYLIDYQFCPYENWISYIVCCVDTLFRAALKNITDGRHKLVLIVFKYLQTTLQYFLAAVTTFVMGPSI